MSKKLMLVFGIIGMAAALPVSSKAAPGAPVQILPTAVEQVTFWGEPFPYRYRYRHLGCRRYVKIVTGNGTRVRRVVVCR